MIRYLKAIPLIILCAWSSPVMTADRESSPPPAGGRKVALALPRTKGDGPVKQTTPLTLPASKPTADLDDLFPQASRNVKRLPIGTPMTPPAEIVKAVTDASRLADQMAKSSSLGAPAQFLAWTISSLKQINSWQMSPLSSPHLQGEKWSLPELSRKNVDR